VVNRRNHGQVPVQSRETRIVERTWQTNWGGSRSGESERGQGTLDETMGRSDKGKVLWVRRVSGLARISSWRQDQKSERHHKGESYAKSFAHCRRRNK